MSKPTKAPQLEAVPAPNAEATTSTTGEPSPSAANAEPVPGKRPPAKAPKTKKTPVAAAPRAEKVPTEEFNFGALVAGLKKKYEGKVFYGDEYTMPWLIRRLPTGLLELDLALQGGLPAGGMTMIVGAESVGKNFLCNKIMANQQRIYGDKCRLGIVSTELVYDKLFGQDCGMYVPLSIEEIEAYCRSYREMLGEDPPYEVLERMMAKVGDVVLVPPGTAEDSLDIAVDMIKSRQFNVVMIDSFGSLLTENEDEKTFSDKAKVGGSANLNTSFARKLNAAMTPDSLGRPNLTCVIGINQMRANMNKATPFSPDKVEAGAWAMKHGRWVTIDLNRGERITVGEKDTKKVLGKNIHWEIKKQKAGGHEGAFGSFAHYFAIPGWDRAREVLRVATQYKLLSKSGAWYIYGEQRLGNGLDAAAANLEKNPELLVSLEKAVFVAAQIHCNY